jgi:hypothetical protein
MSASSAEPISIPQSEVLKGERLLRRTQAADYVVENYNIPCSPKTLAKLACVSSEGPPFRLAGRFPLYPASGLDAWAQNKIGPLVCSTSSRLTRGAAAEPRSKVNGLA